MIKWLNQPPLFSVARPDLISVTQKVMSLVKTWLATFHKKVLASEVSWTSCSKNNNVLSWVIPWILTIYQIYWQTPYFKITSTEYLLLTWPGLMKIAGYEVRLAYELPQSIFSISKIQQNSTKWLLIYS